MYNLTKNQLIKNSTVLTPDHLSNHIYNLVKRKPFINILDIGCFNGSLSKPFKNKRNSKIIGLDIIDDYEKNFDKFIKKDFLLTTEKDFEELEIDLIVSNPPFNDLLSFKFLEHCLKLFPNLPIIFIVPEYILNNSKNRSIEIEKYNITKIIKLNQYTFKDVAIHSSIIFLNIHFKNKKVFEYYYEKKEEEKKGKIRTLYFTKEEEEYLKNTLKINNFTKYIKTLIKEKNPDFPLKTIK